MKITSYIRPAPSWTVEMVRAYLQKHHPEDFNLVDVSQPQEYAAGHLPGALLLPLDSLEERLHELDPEKPTIVYGGSGLPGRAAANLLVNAGFQQVHCMEGGVAAWQGKAAYGLPQQEFAFFAAAGTPQEHIALAWRLEEGARLFYSGVAELVHDRQAASLFRELVTAEEHHKVTLLSLYEGVSGHPAAADFPRGLLAQEPAGELMEGGMWVAEALEWTQGKQIRDILELAMSLETNAYDRYLLLRRQLPDENSRRVFEILSDEERRHLQKLTELLTHFI
ncbi:MAG: hypothetical protein IH614_02510 [Desulfuromonadales bacterium]|nr:hypothetical protein [Desulfuromonadales bacterium]